MPPEQMESGHQELQESGKTATSSASSAVLQNGQGTTESTPTGSETSQPTTGGDGVVRVNGEAHLDLSTLGEDAQKSFGRRKVETVQGVVDMALNLEKKLGLANPVEAPVAGEMGAWLKTNAGAIGVPEKPEDYAVPDVKLPEGMEMDTALVEKARAFAHERNIPRDLFAEFAGFVMQDRVAQFEAAGEAAATTKETLMKELRDEWKGDFDKNIETARLAARHLAESDDVINQLDADMGSAALVRHYAKLGGMLGEGTIALGESSGSAGAVLEAQGEIDRLRTDTDFMERLHDKAKTGHREALARWTQLHKTVAGETAD